MHACQTIGRRCAIAMPSFYDVTSIIMLRSIAGSQLHTRIYPQTSCYLELGPKLFAGGDVLVSTEGQWDCRP